VAAEGLHEAALDELSKLKEMCVEGESYDLVVIDMINLLLCAVVCGCCCCLAEGAFTISATVHCPAPAVSA